MNTILITDNQLSREGLRALIEKYPNGYNIVGEASNGAEALQKLEMLQPDILLTDIDMPGLNGIELTKKAEQVSPGTKVIIYSAKSDDEHVLSALRAGARGYILKTDGFDRLRDALNKVNSGRYYLSDEISDKIVEYYCRSNHNGNKLENLTNREKEVLYLVKEGLSSTEIARRLAISHRTAEVHRFRAMKKLHLRNQGEVVRYFLDEVELNRAGVKSQDVPY